MDDHFYEQAKEALWKAGYDITHDPYVLRYKGTRLKADLGVEKVVAVSKGEHYAVIEIKSFLSESKIYEWHRAVGQYDNYRMILEVQDPDRVLYMAVADFIYDTFFQTPFIQDSIARNKIKIMVFNPETRTIITWID